MQIMKRCLFMLCAPLMLAIAIIGTIAQPLLYTVAKACEKCADGLAKFEAEMVDGYCSRSELASKIQTMMKESNGFRQSGAGEGIGAEEVGWRDTTLQTS